MTDPALEHDQARRIEVTDHELELILRALDRFQQHSFEPTVHSSIAALWHRLRQKPGVRL